MGTSSVIVVPKPVVDGFGLKRGQKIQLIVTDDKITIPMGVAANETKLLRSHQNGRFLRVE